MTVEEAMAKLRDHARASPGTVAWVAAFLMEGARRVAEQPQGAPAAEVARDGAALLRAVLLDSMPPALHHVIECAIEGKDPWGSKADV